MKKLYAAYENNGLDPEILERALERTEELRLEETVWPDWDLGGPGLG